MEKKLNKDNQDFVKKEWPNDDNVMGYIDVYEEKVKRLNETINDLKDKLNQEKIEKLELSKKLYNEYNNIEKLLNDYKILQEKYNALRKSKLGKLTLIYWRFRHKIKSWGNYEK